MHNQIIISTRKQYKLFISQTSTNINTTHNAFMNFHYAEDITLDKCQSAAQAFARCDAMNYYVAHMPL